MKDKNNAIRWGLTVFVTVAAILLFYDTLFGRRVLLNITRQFLRALQPVISAVCWPICWPRPLILLRTRCFPGG